MTESELNSFISNADWNTQARYKIKVPQDTTLVTNRSPLTKSNVQVLPLSLDDNNTIVGTMSTLDQSTTFHLILCQVHLMFTQVDPTLSCLLVSTTVKVTWASWKGNSEAEKEKLIGLLIKSWILKKSVQGTESSSTTLEGERQRFETEDKLYVLLSCLTQLHQTVRKATWPLFVNSPEHTWGKCKRPLEKIPPSCRCRTGPWEFCQMFGWHGSRSE